MGEFAEWTDSEADLYPGSKLKIPDELAEKPMRIIRGLLNNDVSDPITNRFWQARDFHAAKLGFRVVCNINKN
jgi:formylglycine-generating enzyme required for sulfatase activity